MSEPTTDYGRNKYHRTIKSCLPDDHSELTVDVYSILLACGVTCPARQHAVKKLLCAGLRGKADQLTDLKEARVALDRAIHIQEQEQ